MTRAESLAAQKDLHVRHVRARRAGAQEIAAGIRGLKHIAYTLTTIGEDQQRTQNLANIYVKLTPLADRPVSQFDIMGQVRDQALPKFAQYKLRAIVSPVSPISGGGARFNGFEVQTAESNANAVNMMGFSRVPDITAALERANAGIGLELKKRYDNNSSNLVRRSDQWPFLQRGVPAMGFMTGLHPDYHTQYDRPEKINYAKMEKIARLIHQASWDIANAEARPKAPAMRLSTQLNKPPRH